MNTWVVFLRGVNVSGKRKLRMDNLREGLEAKGFSRVKTYIQSGNLVLQTVKDKEGTAKNIEDVITKEFGFDVPVIALSQSELKQILDIAPFKEAEPQKRYFTLLLHKPKPEDMVSFKALVFEGEAFELKENCVYLHCKNGAAKAKLNNALIEKKLKVSATTRNLNTMHKMLQMIQEMEG